jgi:hypothetical protein
LTTNLNLIPNKVFCIGFHKTGTKSIGSALSTLGYRVCGPTGVQDPHIAKNISAYIEKALSQFDAFQDNPWPIVFDNLDTRVPGSKFILTLRPEEQWISSMVSHFGDLDTPMREWIYGVGHPRGHETCYLQRYRDHNRDVFDYFKNRKTDLLVLDLTQDFTWQKLCEFLDKPLPHLPFPYLNPKNARIDGTA